jgi:hypothetical protein
MLWAVGCAFLDQLYLSTDPGLVPQALETGCMRSARGEPAGESDDAAAGFFEAPVGSGQ